tara:strand:+ start:836 stop:994 length:159 start_codon:yes stop_codon:yes gene_type:complete
MDYNEKKAELEAKFKPASAAMRLESWLLDNPDMAPKAAKKEKVVEEKQAEKE